MSQSFSYEMHLDEGPVKARIRVRVSLTEQLAQSAGMTPVGDPAQAMTFAPTLSWPLLPAVARRLSGQKITLKFSDAEPGTNVAVSGRVAGDGGVVATQEFWTKAFSPPA